MPHANHEDRLRCIRERYKQNPEPFKRRLQRWYALRPRQRFIYKLQHYYNMAVELYDSMWKQQNGVCAISKKPETKVTKGTLQSLSVDHNHNTKQIRGLLRSDINKALGTFDDSPDMLINAAEYLVDRDDSKKPIQIVDGRISVNCYL